MTVPSSLNTPNATASSNDPQGSEAVFPSLDDYIRAHASFIAQIRDHRHEYLSTVAGTVDAITGTTSSGAPNALSAGQIFWFKASGANTSTTPTININTIGAKTIKRQDGSALAAGDIPASGNIVLLGYDGTDMIYLNCPRVTKADLATTASSVPDSENPGIIKDFGGETPPAGYFECDGSSLLRSAYPELFAAIGTLHGAADALHFNIPDHRGRFKRGWSHGTGNDAGAASRTASASGGATGDHVGTQQGAYAGNNTFATYQDDGDSGTGANSSVQNMTVNGVTVASGGQGSGTVDTNPGDTRPINAAVMSIIKY